MSRKIPERKKEEAEAVSGREVSGKTGPDREVLIPGTEYRKTGYLTGEYRIFHLTGSLKARVPAHYHDFHKIMILLRGNLTYMIEGREYQMVSGDLILVRAGEIHCPLIGEEAVYERVIIYLSPDFREGDDLDLLAFLDRKGGAPGLVRPEGNAQRRLSELGSSLAELTKDERFGAELLRKVRLVELLIFLNRMTLEREQPAGQEDQGEDMVGGILDYISDHLSEDSLCVDLLADRFAMSRSGLMHLFRRKTGCTVASYISEKRLFLARGWITSGMAVTDACYRCGFGSYGAFYHAYRKRYGTAPGKGKERLSAMLEE